MGPFKMSRTILISLFLREGTCLYRSCVLALIADDSEFEDVTDDVDNSKNKLNNLMSY